MTVQSSELLPCLGKRDLCDLSGAVRWWKAQQLCPTQQREISRLEKQLERLHTTIDAILSLAEQLKEAAIEKVFGKSALRALSVLSGKLLSNLPCRRSLSLRGMVICIRRRR